VRIVVALGGNALLRRGDAPDAARQADRLAVAAPALARLAAVNEVAIVHGNGPQVGLLAAENEGDRSLAAPYPLADMVAESQGLIGFWIQRALEQAGLIKDVVVLVTRTQVDPADEAFAAPSKFIGTIFTEAQARSLAQTRGWQLAADGESWRRVVASPRPLRILEAGRAASLLDSDAIVVVAGGGGIPVVGEGPAIHAVDAVVDKDFAALRVATDIGAELLIILTDVEGVFTDFGTPAARLLHTATPALLDSLEFGGGSMGPKVQAASDFVRGGGRRAIIASLDDLDAAIAGTAGTQIAEALTAVTPSHLVT
jgi:carbamate kinase